MTDTTPIDRESVGPLYVKHPVDGVIRRLDEHYDVQSDVEQDPCGAWFAIQDLCAALDAAEAKLAKAVEALEDVAGVGFDAPMTWAGTDADWERKRANAMQWRARDTLAELTGGKTDDHTD